MIYRNKKLNMSSSNGSFVTAIILRHKQQLDFTQLPCWSTKKIPSQYLCIVVSSANTEHFIDLS
jgi:hypothetical protein